MDTEPEEIIILPEEDDLLSLSLEKFSWDKPMALALINEYKKYRKEFNNPMQKKRTIWQQIAQNLIKQGFTTVRTEHCEKKWRNLKKTFKDIYLGNRSCKSKVKWGFYELLEDVFGNDPEIIKHANKRNGDICNSVQNKIIKLEGQHVEVIDIVEDSYEEVQKDEDYNIEAEDKEEQQPPDWFLTFLQQYREDEERKLEMLQNMHSEIVALEREKCLLLEKLIQKLPFKTDNERESASENKTSNGQSKNS